MIILKKNRVVDQLSLISVFFSFFFLSNSLALHNVGFAMSLLAALFGGYFIFYWRKIKYEPIFIVVALLFSLICIGATYSLSSWGDALGINFSKYSKILFAVVILSLFLDEKRRNLAYKSFFIGSTLVLISSYLNVWVNLPWSVTQNTGWGVDHTVFGNYITQNIMMSFYVLLCFFYARGVQALKYKLSLYVMAILAIVSILYLSSGRTGYVTLIAGVFLYALFSLPRRWSWVAGILMVLAVGVAFQTSERIQERYALAQKETALLFEEAERSQVPTFSSIGARWYMWIKTLENIQERPWTGWGLGSHGIKWCEKAPQPVWCDVGDTTPHNQFLFFTVELGVLGLVLFLALFGVLVWAGLSNSYFSPLMMGFVGIFFMDSLVNASLWNSREYNFFVLMMVLLYASCRFSGENKNV